mgnify:CR=1 FL=1
MYVKDPVFQNSANDLLVSGTPDTRNLFSTTWEISQFIVPSAEGLAL